MAEISGAADYSEKEKTWIEDWLKGKAERCSACSFENLAIGRLFETSGRMHLLPVICNRCSHVDLFFAKDVADALKVLARK